MRRFKSFSTPLLSPDDVLEFELDGRTFRCKPTLQGRTLLEFVASSASEDYGQTAEMILNFLDNSIVPEQRDEFRALTSGDDVVVPMELLSDIASWLVEEYSGGGDEGKDSSTTESSASFSGVPTTGSTSEDVPSQTGFPSATLTPQT